MRIAHGRRAVGVALLVILVALPGCAQLGETAADLRGKLDNIDLRETIGNLTDCDNLSDAFVGLVGVAADNIDGLAEVTDGRVPATDIRKVVDDVSVSSYFEIAERLGCSRIQMQLDLVNQIIEIDTDTVDGDEFIDQIVDQVQQAA